MGNLRIVHILPTAPQNVSEPFRIPFASNPTQLTKVKSMATTVATLKIFKLNFFILFDFIYLSGFRLIEYT
jgi:hypothetical protein